VSNIFEMQDEFKFVFSQIIAKFVLQFLENPIIYQYIMARVCEVSGKRPVSGYHVSKSNNKVKRKFYPNLQKKRFYLPEEDKWITLKVSTRALKRINRRGITAVVKEMRANGQRI